MGRGGRGRDGAGWDGTGRDGTARDRMVQDVTGRDGTGWDGTRQHGTGRDETRRTERNGAGQDWTTRWGAMRRDGTGRDATNLKEENPLSFYEDSLYVHNTHTTIGRLHTDRHPTTHSQIKIPERYPFLGEAWAWTVS